MKTGNLVLPAVAGLLLSAAAAADEIDLTVSAGVSHSDNIGRVGTGKESDTMPEAGVVLSYLREGRLTTNISADLTYRSYTNSQFDDDLLGGIDASLVYGFIPDRLSWTIEDNFGQSFIDPLAVETPGNRQDLNYFSTGPDIEFPLGEQTAVLISGRWSDVYYEFSEFSSKQRSGSIGLERKLNATSSLSISGATKRVEFDESPPNSDYDLHSYYVEYELEGSRSQLSLRGGYTELHDLGETADGPLLNISLTRELTARSKLRFDAGTAFNDSADTFRRDRGIAGISPDNADSIPSRDAFQQDYAALSMTIAAARTTIRLSADWRHEDHEIDTFLDRDRLGAGVGLSRRMSPRLTGSLYGSFDTEEFDQTGVSFDDWIAGAGLEWEMAPGHAVSLNAEHNERNGEIAGLSGSQDYQENRFTLKYLYSPDR